jgi:hypothetical protein
MHTRFTGKNPTHRSVADDVVVHIEALRCHKCRLLGSKVGKEGVHQAVVDQGGTWTEPFLPLLCHCPATALPLPRHCPATAPPLLRHCSATAPPLLCHCSATALPAWLQVVACEAQRAVRALVFHHGAAAAAGAGRSGMGGRSRCPRTRTSRAPPLTLRQLRSAHPSHIPCRLLGSGSASSRPGCGSVQSRPA